MSTNDGGPAFPTGKWAEWGDSKQGEIAGGMTLRDYFAAKALGALLVGVTGVTPENRSNVFGLIAGASYDIADAMLAARSTP
ncbi:MAG: hypothetical protein RJA63_3280 [Pseudomonadota bacterium]|jgi:hypothetical protein